MFTISFAIAISVITGPPVAPTYEAELIFPLHHQHNHAPGVVECPNGDLLVSWYRGSGERKADDVAVFGARRQSGEKTWSMPFLLADHPEFPDCNTCLMIDRKQRLWLFWPIILANSWESCLTNYKVSSNYQGTGAPKWDNHGVIFLKPADFGPAGIEQLDKMLKNLPRELSEREQKYVEIARVKLKDKLSQRLGWQPRCKPTVLPSGRILMPLYSDTFSISIMAISDDDGRTWHASEPLLGYGAIQPSVLRRNDGTLVAYMRENGITERVRVCESKDDGETWGPVTASSLPNPGSGLDGMRLASGDWLLVYNDTKKGRHRLAASLSTDEGRSWKHSRYLENDPEGRFHYPAVTQGKDGTIHVVYSYFVKGGKCMKHAALNETWIRAGEGK